MSHRMSRRTLGTTLGTFQRCVAGLAAVAFFLAPGALAQQLPSNEPVQYGPYNATFLPDGQGLRFPIANGNDTVLLPSSPWTLSCWYKVQEPVTGLQVLAGLGNVSDEYPRFLALRAGQVVLWDGAGNELAGPATPKPGEWHRITAIFDGTTFHLYSDTTAVAAGPLVLGTASPVLQLAPPVIVAEQGSHFGGSIASFVALRRALSDAEVKSTYQHPPAFNLIDYDLGSKPWPLQTRGQAGYQGPQDPAQRPVSRAPLGQPVAIRRAPVGASLQSTQKGEWVFNDGWTLREAPLTRANGPELSTQTFSDTGWMRATVPGTVLTTMVDDGIYPDPYYGLNNLAIPETLNKQEYWYRNTFQVPAEMGSALAAGGAHIQLNFQGINYQAEIWLNGTRLGSIKGAFIRGTFDVTALLKPGQRNVLAVRIAPPLHPGIPQEQSVLGGPGENGGAMELDGPTFLATEGWDWLPAMRDRDSGIWQPVTLTLTQALSLGDPQVLTTFRDHDTAQAAVAITVPVLNRSDHPIVAFIHASVDSLAVDKQVTIPPGTTDVKLQPADFPQLNLQHPRLWWPNGYGKPELYTLSLEVRMGTVLSDTRTLRFGVREVSYELSLLDTTGHLRRVEFTPALAPTATSPIVDIRHSGMREIPGADAIALNIPESKRSEYMYQSWVSSLAPGADSSPAIRTIADGGPAPYLVLRVNGVRIAVRGGNWGMDDARKRVSRERLEPYFRLNRDAHLNIIRNWVGQSTEESFYQLADEYGMMVWNDFWESTENYNLEAQDPALFLSNAADTIRRFRNHPSIVLWCGRNEGVPQPIINQGLDDLIRTLDGTRFYSPSSNQVNLQQSGPYSYQDPSLYYTTLNRGFSVETGTPSMSTLESFQSSTPAADQWPIGDVWAYHDWHAIGNGRTAPFMAEMESEFGAPTSLPDFERKAQMLDFVDHRAIFEGMNANLWAPNSGRLLWMSQPAWPSTMWQILSSDYDTQSSFYGTMLGAEPLHVQLNLANYGVDVVNATTVAHTALTVSARVLSLSNELLMQNSQLIDLATDSVAHAFRFALASLLPRSMVLVELQLTDAAGTMLSRNLYWLGEKPSSYRELNRLPAVPLRMTGSVATAGTETTISLKLMNSGSAAALASKLTLLGSDGKRILPAYYSNNYISLLPGESETVQIHFPFAAAGKEARITLRGWNAQPQFLDIKLSR